MDLDAFLLYGTYKKFCNYYLLNFDSYRYVLLFDEKRAYVLKTGLAFSKADISVHTKHLHISLSTLDTYGPPCPQGIYGPKSTQD